MRHWLVAVLMLIAPTMVSAGQRWPAPQFPIHGSEQRISGRLVTAHFINRTGQIRRGDTDELVDFTLAPYAQIRYLGEQADLRDVPLGTECELAVVTDSLQRQPRVALLECRAFIEASGRAKEEQRQRYISFTKARGLAGWIDCAEGDILTITLFGEPKGFKETWLADFKLKQELNVCVANDELRTWNPRSDRERTTLVEIRDVPTDCFGSSGVQIVVKTDYMLEGFRRGRCVRVFGHAWLVQDQPYAESLMSYGYTVVKTVELIELPPKEYPGQFPFRTDYGNRDLPWYPLKPGEPPPRFSEHAVFGAITKLAPDGRSGQFRSERSGELVDFTLVPGGEVRYLNAPAALADIPLGVRCRFGMYHDERGRFAQATLVSDEFSYMAENLLAYRIEKILPNGTLHVARQLPEVKNYNGDMEQPPDIGRAELRVDGETRVFNASGPAKLKDLAIGDVLLMNLTIDRPHEPARATGVWIGPEAQQHATAEQAKKKRAVAKK